MFIFLRARLPVPARTAKANLPEAGELAAEALADGAEEKKYAEGEDDDLGRFFAPRCLSRFSGNFFEVTFFLKFVDFLLEYLSTEFFQIVEYHSNE